MEALGLSQPFIVHETQKVVLELTVVVNGTPVKSKVPPDEALYQFNVPPLQPVTSFPSIVTSPMQFSKLVVIGAAGVGFTVSVLAQVLWQPFTSVIVTV